MYSRKILITTNEIINKGSELGLTIKQIEHDFISMYYQSNDILTYKDMVLSSGTNSFYFKISDKNRIHDRYPYYMIEPTDVFKMDESSKRLNYIKPFNSVDPDNVVELYNEYVEKYNNASVKESVLEASFPFYIRYENSKNPKIQIFDMHIDQTELLGIKEYNESVALDKLDISFLKIIRNPFRGSTNGSFDKNIANQYVVQFVVYTGKNTINKLIQQANAPDYRERYVNAVDKDLYFKQYVTFELHMIGVNSPDTKYTIKPTNLQILNLDSMETDGYIVYQTYFNTNNFINESKQIDLSEVAPLGSPIEDSSYNKVSVDTTIKFELIGKFNDSRNNPDNLACIKYETENIELVKYLTDNFNINFDIEVAPPVYQTYETPVFKTYTGSKRLKNIGYDPTNTDIYDPNHYEFQVETVDGRVILNVLDSSDFSVPIYLYAHSEGDTVFKYTPIAYEEYLNGPDDDKEYFIEYGIDEDEETVYKKISLEDSEFDGARFENIDGEWINTGIKYFTAKAIIKHNVNDFIYYYTDENGVEHIADDVNTNDDVNYYMKPMPDTYIGICKNVPWINRLYMAGESMYKKIVSMYYDIIDRTSEIRKILFDGGKIFIGLFNTSGKSTKFMASKLSNNSYENLNNLALSISYRVKYNTNDNIEYNNEQIKNATMNYIKNIGNSNFTVDKLFENIKSNVPDIEYINIININNYKNGEVQTILNDSTVVDEILTVSQKLTTDENGDIDFIPDINIDVVQVDL